MSGKVDNKVIYINHKECEKVKQDLYKNERMYIVELNGSKIQS
jgi:hypothetical protein